MKLTQRISIVSLCLVALCATAQAEGGDKAAKAQKAAEQKTAKLIEKYDVNGDGMLSADELVTAINDKAIIIKGEKKPKKEKEPDHASEE